MCKWMCWLPCANPCDRLCLTQIVEKTHIHASSPFTALSFHTRWRWVRTHTGALGPRGNDNIDMLMCANDVVISWRVQMEREINTDATGNKVWVHRHMWVCEWVRCVGDSCDVCWMEDCGEDGGCVCQACLLLPFPLKLWPPPPAEHPTGRRADPREWLSDSVNAYLLCLCPVFQMNWAHLWIFLRTASSIWISAEWEHMPVPCGSANVTSSHSFDSTLCYFIAIVAVYTKEHVRFYHLAIQPHAFTSLHHVHPHTQAYTHSSSSEISLSPMLNVLKKDNKE